MVQHRPYFDALAIGEEIDVDSGSRHQFPGGRKSEKIPAMGAVKREPMDHLFALGNDVLDLNPHVGKRFQEIGVVVP